MVGNECEQMLVVKTSKGIAVELAIGVSAEEECREVVGLLFQDAVVLFLGAVVLLKLHVPRSLLKPQVYAVGVPRETVGSLFETVAHLLSRVLRLSGKHAEHQNSGKYCQSLHELYTLNNELNNPGSHLAGAIVWMTFGLDFGRAHIGVKRCLHGFSYGCTFFLQPQVLEHHGC